MRDRGELVVADGMVQAVDGSMAGRTDLACPVCAAPVVIQGDGTDWASAHADPPRDLHDPETRASRQGRAILESRFAELFPSALHGASEPLDGWRADVALVSGRGVRLVVEHQTGPWSAKEVAMAHASAAAAGAALLWFLDRSAVRITHRRGTPLPVITLDEGATSVIAHGHALILLDPARAEIIHVALHPEAIDAAREGRVRRIGRCECILRSYPLSQLRLSEGMTCVIPGFDAPPPALPGCPASIS